jgi:hypothetical protein
VGDEETRQYLDERKKAYQLVFNPDQPADIFVLDDLARFCRANESCLVPGDHDRTAALEGRREVWLRIQQHLGLNPEQLFSLYSGNTPRQRNAK